LNFDKMEQMANIYRRGKRKSEKKKVKKKVKKV